MASHSNQWKVVGAPKKTKNNLISNGTSTTDKKADKNQDNVNKEKQGNTGKMSTHKLRQMRIKFDAEEAATAEEAAGMAAVVAAAAAQKKNSKTTNKKPVPARPKNLREAISKLNLSELQNLCKVLMAQFSETPLVWLKDLTSFLNIRLNPTGAVDPAYRHENSTAPLDYLTVPIKQFLMGVVQQCSMEVLALFHRHCFTCMLHEAMRGLPVHGYAIFIQLVGGACREACLVHVDEYLQLRELYDRQPRSGLTLVWLFTHTAAAAVAVKQHGTAFTVWMDGLLPLVGSKQLSALALQCGKDIACKLEQAHLNYQARNTPIVRPPGPTTPTAAVVSEAQLLWLFDACFGPTAAAATPRLVVKQLTDIYNKIKVVAVRGSASPSSLFQRLLVRLQPGCTGTEAHQVAILCVCCLEEDEDSCWQTWRTSFTKQLLPSVKLLKLFSTTEGGLRVLASYRAEQELTLMNSRLDTAAVTHTTVAAREAHREAKRVVTRQLETMTNSYHSSSNDGGSVVGSGSKLHRVWLFVCLLSAVVAMLIGYTAVNLHQYKDEFHTTLLGKLSDRAGILHQVLYAVEATAEVATHAVQHVREAWGHVVEVYTPYVAVLGEKLSVAADALHHHVIAACHSLTTRFPNVAATTAGWQQWAEDGAQAAWRRVFPLFQRILHNISGVVTADNLKSAVVALHNLTEAAAVRAHTVLFSLLEAATAAATAATTPAAASNTSSSGQDQQ